MTLIQWFMLSIFIGTFVGLIKYPNEPERVFSIATLVCLAASFVTTEDVLHNAVNPGLVTLVLLVFCSFAFERTSVLRRLSGVLMNGSKLETSIRTLLSAALASSVMNNTAVVAGLLNTIKNNTVVNPGKLLLPLSYAAILGGTLTLVGTSTNLLVNSLYIEQTKLSLGFFDFTLVGLTALVVCLAIILLRLKSLPDIDQAPLKTNEYLLEAKVQDTSKLIGKSIEENGLRNLDSLFLVELVRDSRLISPVKPDEVIQRGDKLIFTGDISKVLTLQQFDGLVLFAEQESLLRDNLTEVVVKPESAIVGKSLKTAGFRARFDAAVVAIRREGETLSGKLGEQIIQSGDFLVLAVGKDFSSRSNLSKNFYILSGHKPANMLNGWRDKITIYGLVITVAVSALTSLTLLKCLLFYFALLVFSQCINMNEIKRRFPLEIWLIVLSALTLAKALENTGVAVVLAQGLESVLQGQSIYFAFIIVFICTLLVTELITNNAAAALVFPIAYNIAIGFDVSPLPFVMAVAFAASGSFISPYGYQTNLMVYNAGNYRLKDFVKFGIPVSIAYAAVMIFMIPLVFPF